MLAVGGSRRSNTAANELRHLPLPARVDENAPSLASKSKKEPSMLHHLYGGVLVLFHTFGGVLASIGHFLHTMDQVGLK